MASGTPVFRAPQRPMVATRRGNAMPWDCYFRPGEIIHVTAEGIRRGHLVQKPCRRKVRTRRLEYEVVQKVHDDHFVVRVPDWLS